MGGQSSKEEVIIAETASGAGQNFANTRQHQQHETTNVLLIIICTALVFGVLVLAYKLAKKCHDKQILTRMNEEKLMRYSSILRRREHKVDNIVWASSHVHVPRAYSPPCPLSDSWSGKVWCVREKIKKRKKTVSNVCNRIYVICNQF